MDEEQQQQQPIEETPTTDQPTEEEQPTAPEEPTPQPPVRTEWRYAQINVETGVCIGVSVLSGEVDAPHMILLDDDSTVQPRDIWDGETWTPAPPPPPPEPSGPSAQERIKALEDENITLMLAVTEIYEQNAAEKAALEEENINTMLALTELYEMNLQLQAQIEALTNGGN